MVRLTYQSGISGVVLLDVEMLQKFILFVPGKGQNRLVAHFNLAALAADIPFYKGQIHKVALVNAQEAIRSQQVVIFLERPRHKGRVLVGEIEPGIVPFAFAANDRVDVHDKKAGQVW